MGNVDWNDADTDLSHLTASHPNATGARVGLTMGASSASTGDHLWQDSWDDDTVEDDFSKALRYVFAKTSHKRIQDTDSRMFCTELNWTSRKHRLPRYRNKIICATN